MKTRTLPSLLLGLSLIVGTGSIPMPSFAATGEALGPQIRLSANQTFSGRFVHEHPVQGFDAPMRTEGRFSMDAADKIVWAIEKPMMTTTTITDAGLTQSVGNFTLLKVSTQQMPYLAQLQQNLLWALGGRWDKLKQDFDVAQKGTREAWEITVTPKQQEGARKPFQKLVARGTYYVEKAEITLPSGTVDHVVFSDPRISP